MKDFLNLIPLKKNLSKIAVAFLLLVFVSLTLTNARLKEYIRKNSVNPQIFVFKVASYPFITTVLGEASSSATFIGSNNSESFQYPSISAHAAVVMDDYSKVILFSKNPTLHFSMASTTKIMTALIGLEYFNLEDVITVKTEGVEGVTVGFKEGERLSFEDVLYAMLLPSGNDAALAIAENYPGGQKAFVEAMNKKAALLHLYNTHFSDPAGLLDEGDFTTVVDLAHLASKALENKVFSSVVLTKQKTISTIDNKNSYTLTNLNKLLGIDGVTGIKTGYTDEAGGVLVTSKVVGENIIIVVVMKSLDRFLDTKILFDAFLSRNLTYKNFSKEAPRY